MSHKYSRRVWLIIGLIVIGLMIALFVPVSIANELPMDRDNVLRLNEYFTIYATGDEKSIAYGDEISIEIDLIDDYDINPTLAGVSFHFHLNTDLVKYVSAKSNIAEEICTTQGFSCSNSIIDADWAFKNDQTLFTDKKIKCMTLYVKAEKTGITEEFLTSAITKENNDIVMTCINGVQLNCEITKQARVIYPVKSIYFEQTNLTLQKGEQTCLTAVITPEYASNQNVSWSSDNESVAKVNAGVVEAVSVGTAHIQVVTEDGSKSAVCTITVTGKKYDYGDLNGDGYVTMVDARIAKRAAMKDPTLDPLSNDAFDAGDLDGNGKITINEARKIKRAAMEETTLP